MIARSKQSVRDGSALKKAGSNPLASKTASAGHPYRAFLRRWAFRPKMRNAPTAAVPKAWRTHALDADGRVADPKAYVFAVMDAWRAATKRRDIFANPGTRYGDPRRGMLDGTTWQESRLVVCRALNR